MKAIQISRTGGPEVLEVVELPTPQPGPGEVLVQAHAIGVGMPDVLVRTGRYPWMPPMPAVIGIEMSGRVVAAGPDVTALKTGDAVFVSARELAFRGNCYAQYLCAAANVPYLLPEGVDLDAAACLSNYQVAWHLLHGAPNGHRFDSVLVWAAAGGVGSAAVQLARLAGKQVIALAGSPAKCDHALAQGAHACIDYKCEDVGARIAQLTDGRGVDLVLDPVGGPGFHRNFAYLAPLGLVVSYGVLEGRPDAAYAAAMQARFGDSLGFRFFSMHVFDGQPARRRAAMDELVPLLAAGKIRPTIFRRLPLHEARGAHELFDSGAVIGKLLLKP
jgi:NADPH2:quinone reductase